jgi:trigger factor
MSSWADYQAAELAGKEATFEIDAKALKRPIDAAIDDDLAKKIGFEGLEQVREALSGQVRQEYEQLSRMRIKRELLDALSEQTSFDAPEGMVEGEFASIWSRVEQDLKAGKLDEEDQGKDEATLRADYRKIAERRVKLGLLLAEIGRANGLLAGIAAGLGQEQQVIEFFRANPQAAETLRGPIFENKVVDYVLELAKVEDKTVTPEELADIPPAQL